MIPRIALLITFGLLTQFSDCDGYAYLKPIMFGDAECVDDNWKSHPIGSVWFDNRNCERIECISHRNILYARGYGCSTIGVPAGCELIPGNGISYPTCCPQVKCKNGVIW